MSDAERLSALEQALETQIELHHEIQQSVGQLRVAVAGLFAEHGPLARIEAGVQGVHRRLALDPEQLPYPQRLTAHRFGCVSQAQEDGVLLAIFERVGVTNRRFVELGCGDNGGNSGFLALELGWSGLMVDRDTACVRVLRRRLRPRGVTIARHWITTASVNKLLENSEMSGEVDLLSIDVDGNDYWIWDAITACSPRVVVVEFNSAFGADRSVTVPYRPRFERDKSVCQGLYYGASIRALASLGRRKGYRLVAGENVNAFFLRDDVAPEIPGCDPGQAYIPYEKDMRRVDALGGEVFHALSAAQLELVEID